MVIARPHKHNALRLGLLDELREQLSRFAGEPGLKLAVLRGAGSQSFAAGGDLQELAEYRTAEQAGEMADRARAALDAVRQFPLPVIAALNGVALGGGAELALACDFRLAAAHAGIGFVQGRLGVTTAWGGGIDLTNRIGAAQALRLLCRAEVVPAAAALGIGLVDEVAEADEPLDALVARFSAPILRQPTQVLRGFKALALGARQSAGYAERVAQERADLIATWVHADHWAAAAKVLNGGVSD